MEKISFETLYRLSSFLDEIEDDEVYHLIDRYAQDLTEQAVGEIQPGSMADQELPDTTSENEVFDMLNTFVNDFNEQLSGIVQAFGDSTELYAKYVSVTKALNDLILEARKTYDELADQEQGAVDGAVQDVQGMTPSYAQMPTQAFQ